MDELTYIDISLIDEPESAMRDEIDEEKLSELTDSIRTNGILQPLVLRPKGERFEVIAGHRRLKAAWRAQVSKIPCVVRPATDSEAIIIRMHENLVREDVDVVSEARFIAQSIEKLGIEVSEFAKILGRSITYVEDRLTIAEMPAAFIDGLRSGDLKLGVALGLMQIPDEAVREDYMYQAMREGATVDLVRYWVKEYFRMYHEHKEAGGQPQAFQPPPPAQEILWPCAKCGGSGPHSGMQVVRIHYPDCPVHSEP